jgi:hypothetical protein
MQKKPSQWLESKKGIEGRKPGEALVEWLNAPLVGPKFVEALLLKAQLVFRWIAKYESLHELNVAQRKGKLPAEFWDSHAELNETLARFTYAPHIDLHELPDGERVSWSLVTEDHLLGLLSVQVRCVVQLFGQGAILRIRRCRHCTLWFFAHFSSQEFCKAACRIKHFAGTDEFKERRRKYMRDRYWLLKTKNVK